MTIEGVAGVQSRMAEIQARMAQLQGLSMRVGTTGNGETTTAQAGTTFTTDQAFTDSMTQAQAATAARLRGGTITTPPPYTGSSVGNVPVSGAAVSGAASTTGSAPVTSADAGDLSPVGVPPELAAYGNGRIPASALSTVGGSNQMLWTPAARAYEAMSAAAARAGIRMGITDSYRSYAEQVDLAQRKGLHSQGGLAAKPGTSDHGWGKSLDLRLDDSAQSWMRAHGAEFGFTENVSREPWHWTYRAD